MEITDRPFVENKLKAFIERDDKEKFIAEINRYSDRNCREILYLVLYWSSVKCAEALITGQTPLSVDLNLPCTKNGLNPLHFVARSACLPSMIELIIFYGGRTDIRVTSVFLEYDNLLPLQIALLQMTVYHVSDWTPKDSIYKLIAALCVPVLQNRLESIGLLAEMTKETEEVFLEYAVEGKIIEFAALLMVAHKKFTKLMHRVRQCFDSSENNHHPIGEYQEKKVASMRQLVEVFDRAGDDISAYIKEDKFYVSARQSIVDVTRLLVKAGFQVADLSDFLWFRYGARSYYEGSNIGERCLNDFGMAHYSKSGYRWKVSNKDPWWRFFNVEAYINELKNEIEGLKEENSNIKKQQQQPNLRIWMDDELGKALEEDDREEFLSVIDRKLDFFHSRQQQLLHAVCGYGSIKCAEALLKGDTRLTVELNHPCTDTGLYPLHCAALSLFPSIVELFIYYGARTDIEFRPCNPLDIYPQHLVEAHARKLPLHMALLAISRLPCIKEWSPKHTIAKLVTLLCLPRMQNPLETLNLLVRTTRDLEYVENEFTQLAIDGKVVEFAAMLSVANMKFSDIKGEVYEIIEGSIDDEDPTPNVESVRWLLRVFDDVGHHITKYIKEDKYNVTKYQAIEDVTCMLQGTDLAPLELSDTDLSVYSWYRDEEPSYPSEAPYENVRLLHDVGMAHYSKSGVRWEVSYKKLYTWRSAKTKAYIKEMENELAHLKEENAIQKKQLQKVLKPAAFGVPYILCQGVPIASSGFFSNDTLKDKVEHKMSRISLNFQNLMSTRGMVSMASSCNLQNFLSRRAMTSSITSFRNIQNFPSSRAMTSSTTLLLKRIMKHK